MQPYFFPYIGYFQLMNAVDEFVVYDNIEFTKKGWINRNRILVNGKDLYISVSVKKDSDFLDIMERYLAENWPFERKKILNRISEAYRRAPFFKVAYPLVEKCILHDDFNLFGFIYNSICKIREYLSIPTILVISSSLQIDHRLKSEQKVLAICKYQKAKAYINSIGGLGLYSKDNFKRNGIDLQFLQSNEISYSQYGDTFVPWLSIIDVMMFNSQEQIKELLGKITLI